MSHENQTYHRDREQHCRSMADLAEDPDIRWRHEELADLHADRASMHDGSGAASAV